MENENISKYLPLAISGLALILGLSNNKKVNRLEMKCSKGFSEIAEVLTNVDASLHACDDNFKIIQKDVNKISHFVGFKGRLGVND